MDMQTKPKRTWKVTKAGYLATIAQLRDRLEAVEGERNGAESEASRWKSEAGLLSELVQAAEHRAVGTYTVIFIVGLLAGFGVGGL